MSKSSNMLRTRRRDNNVKPNRRDCRFNSRLDRKSSRGMIYENEELRLKTININAEIERGQYDIKKLKRENELLKKEIWCLRDEYDKLDKMLKEKIEFSSGSTTCSSSSDSSCSSCSEESEEVETSQNLENVQKTNLKNIHQDFDHLSVVPEEPSTENSEKNSTRNSVPNENWAFDGVIQPDQSYPIYENVHKAQTLPVQEKQPANFFSPIKPSRSFDESSFNQIYPGQYYNNAVGHYPDNFVSKKVVNTNAQNFYQNIMLVPKRETPELDGLEKTGTDLIVKMDNQGFNTPSQSTFSNGGNLEELLNEIESVSQRQDNNFLNHVQRNDLTYYQNPVMDNLVPDQEEQKPYKSELNVVLMPNAMPLLGFDKYKNIQRSFESLNKQPGENVDVAAPEVEANPFFFGNLQDNYVNSDYFNMRYNPDNFPPPPTPSPKPIVTPVPEVQSSENEENLKIKVQEDLKVPDKVEDKKEAKSPKLSIRRKVSIHFKGKKDKSKEAEKPTGGEKKSGLFKVGHQKTPSIESKKSTTETSNVEPKTPTSSDSKTSNEKKTSNGDKLDKSDKKGRKSVSVSPDRKHVHVKDEEHKKHKKHKRPDRSKTRRNTMTSIDPRLLRERSYSVCTDRSVDHRLGFMYDDFSDRDHTSLSSCETINNARKMSTISNIPMNGKVPWCGCWGNGCL